MELKKSTFKTTFKMMSYKILLFVTLLSATVELSNQEELIVCRPDFCSAVKCANITQLCCCRQNKIFVRNGSRCGCCNVCRDMLYEGDNCRQTLIQGPSPPTAQCVEGLFCDRTKGTCQKNLKQSPQ